MPPMFSEFFQMHHSYYYSYPFIPMQPQKLTRDTLPGGAKLYGAKLNNPNFHHKQPVFEATQRK